MVTRTRFNVTFHVHCLSSYLRYHDGFNIEIISEKLKGIKFIIRSDADLHGSYVCVGKCFCRTQTKESKRVWRVIHRRYTTMYQFLFWLLFCGAATQRGPWPPHFWGFLDHTQRRTTVGRTPLDEWSARRRDLYLTTHNTHNRQTSIGLLWTSDQLVAQTSTWQHTTLTTDRHP